MTAGDIPTTTGMPNNGFEGMRFLGYPIFDGLVPGLHQGAHRKIGRLAGEEAVQRLGAIRRVSSGHGLAYLLTILNTPTRAHL